MAFISGVDRILEIKTEGVWIPIGCLTGNSFSESSEMLGTTTRDNTNGWTSSVPTNQSYTIQFEALLTNEYTSTTRVTYYQMKLYKRNKDLIDWRVDDGLGDYDYGKAYISDLGDANNVDEFVSFSGTLQGYGLVSNDEVDRLLLESGHFVLLETDDKIIL